MPEPLVDMVHVGTTQQVGGAEATYFFGGHRARGELAAEVRYGDRHTTGVRTRQ